MLCKQLKRVVCGFCTPLSPVVAICMSINMSFTSKVVCPDVLEGSMIILEGSIANILPSFQHRALYEHLLMNTCVTLVSCLRTPRFSSTCQRVLCQESPSHQSCMVAFSSTSTTLYSLPQGCAPNVVIAREAPQQILQEPT